MGTIRDQENETDIERERGRARDTGIQRYRDTEMHRAGESDCVGQSCACVTRLCV